jgi:hypothetical protein
MGHISFWETGSQSAGQDTPPPPLCGTQDPLLISEEFAARSHSDWYLFNIPYYSIPST